MSRPTDDSLLDHARELMISGLTLKEAAAAIGRTPDRVSVLLRERGFVIPRHKRPAHNAREYPRDMVAKLHADGWSVKKMAQHFGVSRATVRNQLVSDGVKPRNRSEAMTVRMTNASAEERKQLTEAAHAARRGQSDTEECKVRRAQVRSRLVGPGERLVANALREAGIEFDAQAPVHIYNIDLLVGSVAVEPRCGTMNPMNDTERARRTMDLFDRGIRTFWVTYSKVSALAGCLEYVLADLDKMRGDPAFGRPYRVVWCGVENFTRVRNKHGQFAVEPAPVRYTYRAR